MSQAIFTPYSREHTYALRVTVEGVGEHYFRREKQHPRLVELVSEITQATLFRNAFDAKYEAGLHLSVNESGVRLDRKCIYRLLSLPVSSTYPVKLEIAQCCAQTRLPLSFFEVTWSEAAAA